MINGQASWAIEDISGAVAGRINNLCDRSIWGNPKEIVAPKTANEDVSIEINIDEPGVIEQVSGAVARCINDLGDLPRRGGG